MVKAWEVLGYTYDADVHCVKCATRRFGSIDVRTYDTEGNPVHPIFAGDDLADENCGDCLNKLWDVWG